MKKPDYSVDPMATENHGIPLWVVYGVSVYWPGVLCCRIRINEGVPVIWGYSVWKRQPGFRTLGVPVKYWAESHAFCHFFSNQTRMLEYVEKITTPKAGI
jgi:hypothetical protein